jgi:transcriptional regulator with XRE-family HTH domain
MLRRVRCPIGPYFTEKKGYPTSPKTIGEMIRKRRLDLGLLQREATEQLGCDKMTIVNWERGHTTPQVAHMARVIAFLGFNPIDAGATIAERLVNFRKTRGITQKAFASRIGIDQGTLGKWKRGKRKPMGLFLSAVLEAMDEKVAQSVASAVLPTDPCFTATWPIRLLEYRKVHGLSQEQLAAKIGVAQTTVARWESGERQPAGLRLKALMAELSGSR